VTTNRNNGIIVMNNKQNDWANAVEAKGLTFDTAKPIQAGGYNDSLGITNMRKHFKISDTSVDTIITLTKSSDTSKYFMYWGITYWGTPTQPYALHINDMARGGYTLGSLAPVRDSDIRMTNPDLLLMEITCINSYGDGSDITNRKATLKSEIDTFKTYIDTLGIPAGFFIPHLTTASILNSYNEASEFYDYAKGYSLSKGMEIVGDSHQLIRKFWENYHSDIPYLTYVASLMYDGSTHTKEGGFMFYQVLSEELK